MPEKTFYWYGCLTPGTLISHGSSGSMPSQDYVNKLSDLTYVTINTNNFIPQRVSSWTPHIYLKNTDIFETWIKNVTKVRSINTITNAQDISSGEIDIMGNGVREMKHPSTGDYAVTTMTFNVDNPITHFSTGNSPYGTWTIYAIWWE